MSEVEHKRIYITTPNHTIELDDKYACHIPKLGNAAIMYLLDELIELKKEIARLKEYLDL